MNPKSSPENALNLARRVLEIEAEAVSALVPRLDRNFLDALSLILDCHGRVVVSGVGKTGHIARKIAATLASTGTPAYFVHAAEASHGDLGMITRDDVLIAISHSGEGAEILAILPMVKRQGGRIVAITGNPQSTLAREADVHLDCAVAQEACPLNLAPTASTTAALALGDALAVALLDARGFSAEDFARSHPGGALGRKLLTHVRDVMRAGSAVPAVRETASIAEAILEVTRGGIGMTVVVDAGRSVIGLFTDGDLRRVLEKAPDFKSTPISAVMTPGPRTIGADRLAVEAVEMMEQFRINQLPVADDEGRLIGALNMHDLFQAKVI